MSVALLSRPWWEVTLIGVAGLVLLAVVGVVAAILIDDYRTSRKLRRPREASAREARQMLAFPYYVEEGGLRDLAVSLGIELPVSREITRARRLGLAFQGLGGEGSKSVKSQLAGGIDLNRLAHELRFGPVADRVAAGLGEAPYVSDEEVLESAIQTIERSLGETSGTREALARVRETYETARVESVATSKREELRIAAESNSLVFLSGEFDRAIRNGAASNRLRLTRFDPRSEYPDPNVARYVINNPYADMRTIYLSQLEFFGRGPGRRPATRDESIVPAEITIEVVLPDDTALTPAGAERIGRGHPFYARVIAHSPSYERESDSFVCSAYAVWGATRP